jgi:sugar phosphate isomerase/epimerase
LIIGGRAHNIGEVELIAKAGFPFAEISILDKKTFFEEELHSLIRIRDEFGLDYLAHGPEEGNPWETELLRRNFAPHIESLLNCLMELSINLFTIHFWIDKRFIDIKTIEEKIKILKEMVSYASDKGIKLCIENLSERFSDFSTAFDSIEALGMTLDIGHGELLSNKNTAYDFGAHCLQKIDHVHIHDNRGGNSPSDDLHLPLGHGSIDFFSILHDLKSKGFDKTIALEVNPRHMLRGKEIVDNIWKGENTLKEDQV